jgi:hypothetical protein
MFEMEDVEIKTKKCEIISSISNQSHSKKPKRNRRGPDESKQKRKIMNLNVTRSPGLSVGDTSSSCKSLFELEGNDEIGGLK